MFSMMQKREKNMDIKETRKQYAKFRSALNEALFRDKGIKINFVYELDDSFNKQDLMQLIKSCDNMLIQLDKIQQGATK